MKNTKGFTLIELLVVIAIIGILSSVVLASLNTARAKGSDAATKANINNARAQAENFYDTYGTYVGVCGPAGIAQQIAGALSSSGATGTSTGLASATNISCNGISSPSAAWAVQAPLKTSGVYFCVDSTGKATTTIATPATFATTPVCP
jgi:prepilin-type N-terminal cleavage/methylation domain-containing protein